jgi:hypothetical protein
MTSAAYRRAVSAKEVHPRGEPKPRVNATQVSDGMPRIAFLAREPGHCTR